MGLGKVWPDLEISEVFLMGLEASFLHNFFFLPKGFEVLDLSFFFLPFALQESHFSEFMGTAY